MCHQDEYIVGPARTLAEKNLEVERAVGDLIQVVKNYPLVKAVPEINQEDVDRLQQHYNHFLYQGEQRCQRWLEVARGCQRWPSNLTSMPHPMSTGKAK